MATADTRKEASDRADRWLDRRDSIGTRLSTYLLVGNAVPLLMYFNALFDRKVCTWEAFAPLIWAFAIGLAAAFVATLSAWLASFFTQRDLSRLLLLATQAEINEREFHQLREANELSNAVLARFEASNRSVNEHMSGIMRRSWRSTTAEIAGGVFWSVGLVSLVFGLVSALSDQRYVAALCPA